MIIEVAIIVAIIMTIIISSSIIIAIRGNNSRTDRSIVALVNMFHCRCSKVRVTVIATGRVNAIATEPL